MVGSSTSPSKRAFPVLALAAVGLVGLVGTAGPVGAGVGDGMSLDEVKCQNGSTIVVTFVGNSSGQTQQFDVRLDGTPCGRKGITARRKLGAAFVPEERLGHGAVPRFRLSDSVTR